MDPQFVLTNEQILGEVNIIDTFNFDSPLTCVQWCATHRILTNTKSCDNFPQGMTFGSREVCNFQGIRAIRQGHKRNTVQINSFFFQAMNA